MAQQELDLLQFAAGGTAKPNASPAQVVRGEFADARLCGEFLDDVPYGFLRYALAPRDRPRVRVARESDEANRLASTSGLVGSNRIPEPFRYRYHFPGELTMLTYMLLLLLA